MKTCYMCDEIATTDEHAPPQSFFPEDQRKNLITVRSCEKHNTKNSDDVEYVRNCIVSSLGTNSYAREYFNEKVIRSWTRREASLGNRILFGSERVEIKNGEFPDGIEAPYLSLEEDRFNSIFKCIVHALYFNEFGKKLSVKGEYVFSYTQEYLEIFASEDETEQIRQNIANYCAFLPFELRETKNPDVFVYYFYEDVEIVAYKNVFYSGFTNYTIVFKNK